MVWGFRNPIGVACESYLVESCIPLWFRSSQANLSLSGFNTRHSLLAAVSCITLIISLCLASCASLSSPFKSLLRWSPLFSRSDSLWYGVRVVQSTLQAGAQLLKLWYRVLEALLYMLLTRVIWSSHADLFGSGPHKLIALPSTLSRHSRWQQCHAATSIISLHLGSSASLFSPFSSSCYVASHCSAFLSC